jgi:hypothetical protein
MATITFALTFPGGVPMAHAKVEVEFLTGDGSGGYTSGEEVVGKRKFHVEDDGTYTLTDVVPCAGDMEGGVYRIWVEGRHIRDIQPLTDSTWSWLDPDIRAPGAPGVSYTPGAPGGSGYVDTLANLTTEFATAPANTYGTATDVNSGTLFYNDGGTPVQGAPGADEVGVSRLASATLAATSAVTITTGGTMYRSTALTTASFTMPSRPVEARMHPFRAYESGSGNAATVLTQTAQLKYTTDGWSTSQPITGRENCSYLGISPFYISFWHNLSGPIGASPGATVQVALFISHADSGATMTIHYSVADDAARSVPHLAVWG